MFKLKVAGDKDTQFIFLNCGDNAGPVIAEKGKKLGGAFTGGYSSLWKYSEYKNDPENWDFKDYSEVLKNIKGFQTYRQVEIDINKFEEFYNKTICVENKQMKLAHNKIYVLEYSPKLLYYVIDDEKALVLGWEKNTTTSVTHSKNREYELKHWKILEFKNDFENWELYSTEDLYYTLAEKLKQSKQDREKILETIKNYINPALEIKSNKPVSDYLLMGLVGACLVRTKANKLAGIKEYKMLKGGK